MNQTCCTSCPPTCPSAASAPAAWARYHGKSGFDVFSHHKSVLIKPQKPDPKLLYPPYSPLKDTIIHKAL